jgi:hypothetical protein
MTPLPRAVPNRSDPVRVVLRPVPGPHVRRRTRFVWPRLSMMLVTFVAVPAVVVAGEFDASENPWGFGYDGGLTLRRKLGAKWEIGISGGPNDYLSSRSETVFRESDPPSSITSDRNDRDNRRESGFVAPHVGRTVWQRGPFDLVCYLRGTFDWSNTSSYSEGRDNETNDLSIGTTDVKDRDWILLLGFRPGYRPVSWFSVEVSFGLRYTWTKRTYREEDISYKGTGNSTRYLWEYEEHGQTFNLFGYNGISSLQFIVWF